MEIKLKKLLPIPIILFLFSVSVLFVNYFRTGDFILRDVDLKGGTLVTIESSVPIDAKNLEKILEQKYGSVFLSSLRTTTGYGVSVEVSENVDATDVINDIQASGVSVVSHTVETIGPQLGNLFLIQIRNILIIAFVLMSVVIFIVYRNFISSIGIVFASLANIITTLAITSLLGIKISFAGFAGLLMLIAYTVDTNIVLTSKILGMGTEDFRSRYKKALTTGATLIATITITMFLILLLSSSKLLVNIGEILVVGFLSDLPYTWIFNASLLEMWFGRRQKLIS